MVIDQWPCWHHWKPHVATTSTWQSLALFSFPISPCCVFMVTFDVTQRRNPEHLIAPNSGGVPSSPIFKPGWLLVTSSKLINPFFYQARGLCTKFCHLILQPCLAAARRLLWCRNCERPGFSRTATWRLAMPPPLIHKHKRRIRILKNYRCLPISVAWSSCSPGSTWLSWCWSTWTKFWP